mmetsp:Transcript_65745/g.118456  ORF Transcript_65745/g.118456 Transcript_65745/m.118456 type:complete len:777 (+) Transcript_65745:87-2417(+)
MSSGSVVLPRDLEPSPSLEAIIEQSCCRPSSAPAVGDSCPVCLEELLDSESGGLLQVQSCRHCLHEKCLTRWLSEQRRCPVCATSCGTRFGSGPKTGTMTWQRQSQSLPGYAGSGRMVVTFNFPAGSDDAGVPYAGRTAVGFLPDVPEGRQVRQLFEVAFRRRLMFTVGVSLTLGTRWPTFHVHLKTSDRGGASHHGYPDEGYLARAMQELSECGVLPAQRGFTGNKAPAESSCRTSRGKWVAEVQAKVSAAFAASGSSVPISACSSNQTEPGSAAWTVVASRISSNLTSNNRSHSSANQAEQASIAVSLTGMSSGASNCSSADITCVSRSSASSSTVRVQFEAPTPQRKRQRTDQEMQSQSIDSVTVDSDVEVVDCDQPDKGEAASGSQKRRTSLRGCVPCEFCSRMIAFDDYAVHASLHASSSRQTCEETVPCDVCGEMVRFADFEQHASSHASPASSAKPASANAKACKVCDALIEPEDLEDHLAAHRVHEQLVDAELQKSTSEVDLTLQVVDMARKGGSGLPGNRTVLQPEDPLLVRWTDGHWYPAFLKLTQPDGRQHVTWDKPYQDWKAEDVAADSVIPRMNRAREVCNFDVAMAFVKNMKAVCQEHAQRGSVGRLELVYHYTKEENVQKIVENNLKTPGEKNADGSTIPVANGEVYGRGIYASTDMTFSKSFGVGLNCAFMCLALPGRQGKTAKVRIIKADEDSLAFGQLRLFKNSEQLLPLFFTDGERATVLEDCARKIASFLEERQRATSWWAREWKSFKLAGGGEPP